MELMNKKIYSELLSQGNYLRLNKRLIAILGLEMAVFLSFLIDKYDYYSNHNLLNEDSFYFTNNDILIFTGLNTNKIQKLKIEGEKLKLFSTKKLGNPAKTYYTINFETINGFFIQNKPVEELVYERIFQEKVDMNNLNYENLNILSRKELQLLCKKQKIKYYGYYTKTELIQNILEKINEVREENIDNIFENLSEKTFKELREICKFSNISYTGKDNKQLLIEKIKHKKGVDDLVTKKTGNKCINNLVTSDQKNWHNQEQIIISKKQEQNYNHDMSEFEKLFKVLEINFTAKNQNSIKKLLKTMSFSETKNYLIETFENIKNNPNVTNIPALFSSKIEKGERQQKYIFHEKEERKELSQDKKEWLKHFSGIYSDKNLKAEIENIIIDIPIEILIKNKGKFSCIEICNFKKALYQLKNISL